MARLYPSMHTVGAEPRISSSLTTSAPTGRSIAPHGLELVPRPVEVCCSEVVETRWSTPR